MLKRLSLILLSALGLAVAARGADATTIELAEAIILTPQAGGGREEAEIVRWQERASKPNATTECFERLGWAFVAKAHRSLDAGYYKLAESTADVMEARFGASAAARLLRGHVMHNLHRFGEAEAIARHLTGERGEAADFGLLSDALMEQGRLNEAVEALQRMVNLKPGPEAYSRIAHLRWLKGDLPGAIAAMEAAVHASSSRDPATAAWLLARLSTYELQAGAVPRALLVAETAIGLASDYPPALLAAGCALLASGRAEAAVARLRAAEALNPLPEYQWWLADALRAVNRVEEAVAVETRLRERGAVADPRTLALFLATRGEDPAEARRLARAELANRGDGLTHDAMAWALAATGDYATAEREMQRALAEKTKDPRLLLHAGEIALALNRPAAAREFFAQAAPAANALTPAERALLTRRVDAGPPAGRAD